MPDILGDQIVALPHKVINLKFCQQLENLVTEPIISENTGRNKSKLHSSNPQNDL